MHTFTHLDISHGHVLLGLGVVARYPVHGLREELEHQMQVDLIFLRRARKKITGIRQGGVDMSECETPQSPSPVFCARVRGRNSSTKTQVDIIFLGRRREGVQGRQRRACVGATERMICGESESFVDASKSGTLPDLLKPLHDRPARQRTFSPLE